MTRPRIFIGSASENLEIASKLGEMLDDCATKHLWSQEFELGELNLQALQRAAAESDFAIFIWGEEDRTDSREVISGSPRDNVIYETGLFAGALGEHRVFVAHSDNTKIPSDYLGITTATFDSEKPDVAAIARRVRSRVKQIGAKPASRLAGQWWQLVLGDDERSVVSFVDVKPKMDGRSVTIGGHSWTRDGGLIARWDAIATQFDERTETLHYSWEGKHLREPGIPLYIGLGTIRYGLSPMTGDYSSTKRHQCDEPEEAVFKSCFYIPAESDQIDAMRGHDADARKRVVEEMLALRASMD